MGLQSSEASPCPLPTLRVRQLSAVGDSARLIPGSDTPPKRVVCVPWSRPLWTQVRPALALSGYEVPNCGGDGYGARDEVFVVQVLRPHGVAARHQTDSGVQSLGEAFAVTWPGSARQIASPCTTRSPRRAPLDRLAVHHEPRRAPRVRWACHARLRVASSGLRVARSARSAVLRGACLR